MSLSQIHSSKVVNADSIDLENSWNGKLAIEADAAVSSEKGTVLNILTADCLPILFYDPIVSVIGAAHAGWKGSASMIAVKTISEMEKLGSKKENIHIAIGPGIGACCYEVGEEVALHFSEYQEALQSMPEKKYMLDLAIVNKIELISAGIPESNIELSNICTSCNNEKFFSYRREKGCSGRFISFIAMKK